MYELPHELSNDFRKLRNFKKIFEIFGFDGEYLVEHPKAKF